MRNHVWHTRGRDSHVVERACTLFVQIVVAAISMLSMARSSAQPISIADVTSVWKKTVIENVTVEFDVTSHGANAPIILPSELGGGGTHQL